MTERSEHKWYHVYDNVYGLAQWLDGFSYFSGTDEMLRYFEKPWKWGQEYRCYQLWALADKQTAEQITDLAVEDEWEAILETYSVSVQEVCDEPT